MIIECREKIEKKSENRHKYRSCNSVFGHTYMRVKAEDWKTEQTTRLSFRDESLSSTLES